MQLGCQTNRTSMFLQVAVGNFNRLVQCCLLLMVSRTLRLVRMLVLLRWFLVTAVQAMRGRGRRRILQHLLRGQTIIRCRACCSMGHWLFPLHTVQPCLLCKRSSFHLIQTRQATPCTIHYRVHPLPLMTINTLSS